MSSNLSKVVIKTVTGETYVRSFTASTVAEIESVLEGGVDEFIGGFATAIGGGEAAHLKFNAANIGWVALNPRHVVSVEFHGTEDVE